MEYVSRAKDSMRPCDNHQTCLCTGTCLFHRDGSRIKPFPEFYWKSELTKIIEENKDVQRKVE